MLPNRLGFALMNNPVRAALQRHVEAPFLCAWAARSPAAGRSSSAAGAGWGPG